MSASVSSKRKPTEDPLIAILEPALKVGAFSGGAGFLVGGTAGILKSTATPKLFALASAIQCTALGSSFWATRGAVLHAWDTGNQQPGDRSKASGIAGAVSGGITGAVFRGRSNIIPGALVMGLFGWAGQAIHNKWTATPAAPKEDKPKRGFWESMTSIGAVSRLSNEEYAQMLKDRMFKLDVEIALLDDKIAVIKKNQATKPAVEEDPKN